MLLLVVTLEERLPLAHDPALVLSSISVGERYRDTEMRGNITERHSYLMCRRKIKRSQDAWQKNWSHCHRHIWKYNQQQEKRWNRKMFTEGLPQWTSLASSREWSSLRSLFTLNTTRSVTTVFVINSINLNHSLPVLHAIKNYWSGLQNLSIGVSLWNVMAL